MVHIKHSVCSLTCKLSINVSDYYGKFCAMYNVFTPLIVMAAPVVGVVTQLHR